MVTKLMAAQFRPQPWLSWDDFRSRHRTSYTETFYGSPYRVSPVSFLHQASRVDSAEDTNRKISSRRAAILLLGSFLQLSSLNNAGASPSNLDLDSRQKFSDSSSMNMPLPKAQTGVEMFHVASVNTEKKSESSLGLLVCLIFGFLFLKEKRERIATKVALEDSQLQLKLVDTGLRTQIQSNVSWKSKNPKKTSHSWIESKDSLLKHLAATRSTVADLGKKVEAQKKVSESLRWQLNKARTSIAEVERLCNDLVEKLNKEIRKRWTFETELQNLNFEIQQKADEFTNLETMLEKAGLISENLNSSLIDCENSHSKILIKLQDLLVQLGVLKDSLNASEEAIQLLRNQLDCTLNRNKESELMYNELCNDLNSGKDLFVKELTQLNQQLHMKSEHCTLVSADLTAEIDKVKTNQSVVETLVAEREELKNVIHENERTICNLSQRFNLVQKELKACDSDLQEAHEQLIQENAKTVFLEATHKNNPASSQFVELSLELQKLYNEANGLTTKLGNELSSVMETLKSSEFEISSLKELLQSNVKEEEKFRNDLTRLYEDKQLVAKAIKKEKRAAAYANKKLALCNEVLIENRRIIQEIQNNEFRESRILIQSLEDEVSSKTVKLENANTVIACLEEEILQLRMS